jgi:hypothetical protein
MRLAIVLLLLSGCASQRHAVRFYGSEPVTDGQQFICDWDSTRQTHFECVDLEKLREWQAAKNPPISM